MKVVNSEQPQWSETHVSLPSSVTFTVALTLSHLNPSVVKCGDWTILMSPKYKFMGQLHMGNLKEQPKLHTCKFRVSPKILYF